MYLYYKNVRNDEKSERLFDISVEGLSQRKRGLQTLDNRNNVTFESQEVAEERFQDIIAALNSEEVVVYDTTKEIGYWKKDVQTDPVKKTPAKKQPQKAQEKTE